jgi:long-chain acyl-CoA synthetase
MNIPALLRDAAAAHGEKTALLYGATYPERSVTFAELDAEADRVARGLQAHGVEPGDRVAIAMHNTPHFVFAYAGILRARAVVVPLNAFLTDVEIARIIDDCQVKVILGAPPFGDVAKTAAEQSETKPKVISTTEWDSLGSLGEKAADPTIDGEDLAVLAYTSGTTGDPKGVMLSHGNLMSNLEQQTALPEALVDPDDVLFLALPLFHIFGLNVTLGLLIKNAATGVLLEKFEPVPALRAIQDHKVSVIFGAPPMYIAWTSTPGADQYDVSTVRLAISGAAPLSPQVLKTFREIFGVEIYEGYGLTETSPALTSSRVGGTPKPGSVGKVLPGVEMRIVDDHGVDVEVGDTGEIIVRGPNVFKGYWNRDDATKDAFLGDWFRTGDIAVQDEEGYVYLVDRKRDLIIVSGFNVFPSEVEAALLADERIAEAAVVGVPHTYTGEAVKAYVVLHPGAKATEADLINAVSTRLARFKLPESIEVYDSLPRMLTGKILKRALPT